MARYLEGKPLLQVGGAAAAAAALCVVLLGAGAGVREAAPVCAVLLSCLTACQAVLLAAISRFYRGSPAPAIGAGQTALVLAALACLPVSGAGPYLAAAALTLLPTRLVCLVLGVEVRQAMAGAVMAFIFALIFIFAAQVRSS